MKLSKCQLIVLVICTALLFSSTAKSQEKKDTRPVKNIAVLLFNGVELLDFSGPVEVLESAGWVGGKYRTKVYTFSPSGKPLLSQRSVIIDPAYSLENCPEPDIVVLPGGSIGKVKNNKRLLAWLNKLYKKDKIIMSVCNGAFILSNAHLLDGKDATTWHGKIEDLRNQTPKARIHTGVRFVDNGKIITTAGVSAGIDGALHLVSRILGKSAAEKVAKYMEYDNWIPGNGLVMNKTAPK